MTPVRRVNMPERKKNYVMKNTYTLIDQELEPLSLIVVFQRSDSIRHQRYGGPMPAPW